ncbi:MAG: Hpt domain-containing protein [Ruminococcus sp.]|jgi:HPt (histidine-containing phosphotransfer) domain-containing protein|nr:Hpt domain-containing protein [Ruminococcus sp.]
MQSEFISALTEVGVDVKSALSRMLNKEEMYKKFLRKFREDTNIISLKDTIEGSDSFTSEQCEKIFHYAHTVKGVAGNLGLTDVYNESSYISEATRNGSADAGDLKAHLVTLFDYYNKLIAVLDKVL